MASNDPTAGKNEGSTAAASDLPGRQAARADTPFLAGLTRLAAVGQLINVPARTVVIHEGDEDTSVFILLKGAVRIFSAVPGGREITFDTLASGDYFGELNLAGGPRAASVVAQEDSLCAVVSRDVLLAHLAATPSFALAMMMHAIGRARAATVMARRVALVDVYGRLVSVLDRLADPADELPDGLRLVRATQREIASHIGASREMVSRLLKDLKEGGHVQLRSKEITLLGKLPARW